MSFFFLVEGRNSWQRHCDFLEGLEQESLVRLMWSWVGSTCCFTSAPTIVFLKRTIENPYRLPFPTLQLLIFLFICSSHETSQAPIWNFKNSFWKVSLFSLDFPSFPFYLLSKVFLTKGNIQGNFLISPFLNDCSAISMYNKDILFHMISIFLLIQPNRVSIYYLIFSCMSSQHILWAINCGISISFLRGCG